MGLAHSPSIITDGLVVCLDAENIKSFKGRATTNLVISPKSVTTGYATTIPTRTNNQLTNFDGTFTAGLLSGTGSQWIAYTSASTTNNNRYTTSWYVKAGSLTSVYFSWGGAHQGNATNFNFNLSTGAVSGLSAASGESYGVNNLGNGWWRVWITSTLSSGNQYYPQLNIGNGTVYLGGLQIELGSTPSKFVIGTRGATVATGGGFTDISNNQNNAELINGVNETFEGVNALVFDGINDTVILPFNLDYLPALSNFTIGTWIKIASHPTALAAANVHGYKRKAGVLIGAAYYAGTALYWEGDENGTSTNIYSYIRGQDAYRVTSKYSLPLNTWTNLVLVHNYSGNKLQLYVNGSLHNEVAGAAQSYNPSFVPIASNIGINKTQVDGGGVYNYSYLACDLGLVKIYKNKALSGVEIQQNYNSLRKRFGV